MRRETLGLALLASSLAACGVVRGPAPAPQEARPLIARHPAIAPPGPAAPSADPTVTRLDGREGHLACLEHPTIDHWERRLRDSPWTDALLARGEDVIAVVRPLLVEEGVAPALAVLPAIESSYRTDVTSGHGARGLWQLKPGTARDLGLVVARGRDDRVHVERSTRAAAMLLRRLHGRYDDWPLALAAYRLGEGRVDRARRRAGGDASFWEMADAGFLPAACAEYVPRVLALARVMEECPDPAGGKTARQDLR